MGALTSKPYAFTARSWELRSIETIDLLNAEGSNIRVDTRSNAIMRVLPRVNYSLNMDWISDAARFSYDASHRQRVREPELRFNWLLRYTNCKNLLMPVGWSTIFRIYKIFLAKKSSVLIAGDFLDLETYRELQRFASAIGNFGNLEPEQTVSRVHSDLLNYFTLRLRYNDIGSLDVAVFVGFNPRFESPMLNIRFRKAVLQTGLKIFVFGFSGNFNFRFVSVGNEITSFIKLLEGKQKLNKTLRGAEKPAFFFGRAAQKRLDFSLLLDSARAVFHHFLKARRISINVLLPTVSLVNAFYSGVATSKYSYVKEMSPGFLHLLNVDNTFINGSVHKVYQGTHHDLGSINAQLLFPTLSGFERQGSFLNVEGLLQKTLVAVSAPSLSAKSDWRIIRALGVYLEGITDYCVSRNVLDYADLGSQISVSTKLFTDIAGFGIFYKFYFSGFISTGYSNNLANSVTRNSPSMALAASLLSESKNNFIND